MIQLADQYVRDLEAKIKTLEIQLADKELCIVSLEGILTGLDAQINARGGFVEIDDARMKAQLYDKALI